MAVNVLTIFPELSPKAAFLIHNIIIFFSVTQDRAQGRPLKPVHVIGKEYRHVHNGMLTLCMSPAWSSIILRQHSSAHFFTASIHISLYELGSFNKSFNC